MVSILFFIGCLWVALFLGLNLYRRREGAEVAARWLAFLLPPALVTLGALFFYKIHRSILYDWNWIHLQPSFVFMKGLQVYRGPDAGPVLNSIYGPVSVLAYAPAALLTSPEAAMVFAECLAVAFFFVPVLIVHLMAGQRGQRLYPFFGFLCFAFIPLISSPLRSAAFHVHADAPALGLGALALGALAFRKRMHPSFAFFLSGLAAVGAVWTKQVMLPILIALPLYLLLAEGRGAFYRYTAWLAAIGSMVTFFFVLIFGRTELYFNLVTIPMNHPWRGEGFLPAFLKLLREILIVSPILLIAFGLGMSGRRHGREALRESPWIPFVWLAFFMIPASVIGKTKVGGSNNTLCYALYYLVIAATLALVSSAEVAQAKAKRFSVLLMMIFLIIHIPGALYRFAFPHGPPNYARVAYDYLKRYPGEAYFPRLTILSLMAEGKLYHDSTGLRDRRWAGYPVEEEHFVRYIPKRMRLIAFREGADDEMDVMEVPGYNDPAVRDPELPGFLVYLE